jgi:hypothetical protein
MGEIKLTQKEVEVATAMGVSLDAVRRVKADIEAREERQSVGLGLSGYGLLDEQDVGFARLFQLSESQVVELCGGLPAYLKLRLDRQTLKRAGSSVPLLPSTLTEADVIVMKQLDVNATTRARVELEQHKRAVAEAIQSLGKGGN